MSGQIAIAETASSTPYANAQYDIRFVPEPLTDYFRRRSNECADLALGWGCAGKEITAEAFAELAELNAGLAQACAWHTIFPIQLPRAGAVPPEQGEAK